MDKEQTGTPQTKQKQLMPVLQGITVFCALAAGILLLAAGGIIPGILLLASGILTLIVLVCRAISSRQ